MQIGLVIEIPHAVQHIKYMHTVARMEEDGVYVVDQGILVDRGIFFDNAGDLVVEALGGTFHGG